MIQIAIDGPAGSGKSTTAKKIAQLFGHKLHGHGGDVPRRGI